MVSSTHAAGRALGKRSDLLRLSLPMTTATLRFVGPTQQARTQLVQLLREFPQVLFQERAATEYEVTSADSSTLMALASKPGWSLAGGL